MPDGCPGWRHQGRPRHIRSSGERHEAELGELRTSMGLLGRHPGPCSCAPCSGEGRVVSAAVLWGGRVVLVAGKCCRLRDACWGTWAGHAASSWVDGPLFPAWLPADALWPVVSRSWARGARLDPGQRDLCVSLAVAPARSGEQRGSAAVGERQLRARVLPHLGARRVHVEGLGAFRLQSDLRGRVRRVRCARMDV